jgi:serine protease Do
MTTNTRTWSWAVGLVLLLGALPPGAGAVRADEVQDKVKRAAELDTLAAKFNLLNHQGLKDTNCQACHAAPEALSFRSAPDGEILNLVTTKLTGQPQYLAVFHDQADEVLGATLQPVSDSLRAQLGIPAGQGLVVASLAGDGPAAQAGLKENDILLVLADRPLASAEDLPKQLKAAGETAVQLKLVRAGKPLSVQVRPVYRVTLGPAENHQRDFYVGVAVAPPDDTLRSHLDLPAGVGLVATEVIHDSPAAKGGVKAHDILLEMGDKPLDSPETLVAQVQAAGNKATTLKILRAGKPLTVTITPELRKVEADPHHGALRFWELHRDLNVSNLEGWSRLPAHVRNVRGRIPGDAPEADRMETRLDAFDQELKALRKAIEELRDALQAGKAKGS